jgi:hypothetical protein
MSRFALLTFICLILLSCRKNDRAKLLQGYWHRTETQNKRIVHGLDLLDDINFTGDDTFENELGYYQYDEKTFKYLGNKSDYKLKGDSISLFNPIEKHWLSFLITKLDTAQMKLSYRGETLIYQHKKKTYPKPPDFDQIIVSHSGCFGFCPVINTSINSDGSVVFLVIDYIPKKGLYSGNISKARFSELKNNFKLNNINILHEKYTSEVSDRETTTVTFIKNKKIYKTIVDYGEQSTNAFMWSHAQVDSLYKENMLKLTDSLRDLPFIWRGWSYSLIKDNLAVILPESEEFLILLYLRSGKTTDIKFKPNYTLHYSADVDNKFLITTDGRYYRIEGKNSSKTIDIGFNFIELNAEHWNWQKKDKYN